MYSRITVKWRIILSSVVRKTPVFSPSNHFRKIIFVCLRNRFLGSQTNHELRFPDNRFPCWQFLTVQDRVSVQKAVQPFKLNPSFWQIQHRSIQLLLHGKLHHRMEILRHECTFERHRCGLKDFRCWNCTIRTRNVGNMQNRWFSMEIRIFSALFYCLEVYLTSSCHPKRPPEFCIGPRRIILKKSSLCVCGTLPKRPHRIILCRIILPW